jgi:ABC-type glycerol-3-phosphate transport system substrate-binding protein
MLWSTRTRHATMWMTALLLVVLALSLGACSRAAANQATPVSQAQQPTTVQQSAPSSTQTTTNSSTNQVQSTDQQVQQTLQSLDTAQNDVTTSSSVQENAAQP